MRRLKRPMRDDVRMHEEVEEDEILNREYGVEQAEFVRASDADPLSPPEQRTGCKPQFRSRK